MQSDAKANVLLVDDQPGNLLALEAILEDLGQNLVRASSGEHALRRLLDVDFAVILLDVQMPGLDGFETAALLRERERSRGTPIIFLTAFERTDREVFKGYSLGAVDYLFKPIVPEVLRSKVSVFVDLFLKTEQVKRQAEQLRLSERRELERRAAEQKQAWELERLRREAAREKKAAEQLAEADRRKDEFLAMLAHELRNPLAPILNAVHLLRLPGANGAAAQCARDIVERQVRHMARLIDDLLDVSRINRGKIQLRKEAVELAAVVSRAVETTTPLLSSRNHELVVALPPEPVWLEADPTRLEQVLANLLNNAAKYTEPGGYVWLTAECEGAEVVIRVRDTGVGIPPDQLDAVFGLFTQLDRSLASPSQWGLGIGLALVRTLVQMHGGSVNASSAGPGQGSEFVVRLPVLRGPVRQAAANQPPARARTGDKGLRVLVVDDNRDSAESIAMFLELAGHAVRLAHDGPAALEAAAAFHPDVVLLDIGLPHLNGYEVARRLRAQVGSREAFLVALTGYGQPEDQRRSREAGFDRHLVKPIEPDQLTDLLARAEVAAGRAGTLP
jgi:signal transduction histidine kinase